MKVTIDDVIKLAREYIDAGMKIGEALEKAKKELGYQAQTEG
jgi:hypothetical protein